jgi:hypothetical protein
MRLLFLIACLFAAACKPGETSSENVTDTRGEARPARGGQDQFGRMKAAIRAHAEISFGPICAEGGLPGKLTLPDSAFFPIEITGGFPPELAVSIGQARCGGRRSSLFMGSAGQVIQFWTEPEHPTILFEEAMHGFTPRGDKLIVYLHGGYCPDGMGTDQCRVTYQWDGQRFETAEKQPLSSLPKEEWEAVYEYNCLADTAPCRDAINGSRRRLQE